MHEIDLTAFATAHASHAQVVDVREPMEIMRGRIPGALPIPMGQLPARLHELDRSRPVYVVCASGNRSLAMADFLTHSGFDAYSVRGGTRAWAASGRPLQEWSSQARV